MTLKVVRMVIRLSIIGKDSSKNRQNKLKKFEEDDNDCLLKLLLSCRSLSEGVDLKNIHGCVLFIQDRVKLKLNKSSEGQSGHFAMTTIMYYHGMNKLHQI